MRWCGGNPKPGLTEATPVEAAVLTPPWAAASAWGDETARSHMWWHNQSGNKAREESDCSCEGTNRGEGTEECKANTRRRIRQKENRACSVFVVFGADYGSVCFLSNAQVHLRQLHPDAEHQLTFILHCPEPSYHSLKSPIDTTGAWVTTGTRFM